MVTIRPQAVFKPLDIPRLLREMGIRPRKRLGQHFLVDENTLDKIVAAAELQPSDVVLEVGAGLGTLTRRLAAVAGHVVAVELDEKLLTGLRRTVGHLPQVTIIPGDILSLNPAALLTPHLTAPLPTTSSQFPPSHPQYKVVANLPYYITAAVLRHLLEAPLRPCRLVLTVQYEVAQRITARPGEMSLLAVSVQFYGRPSLVARIKPGSFYPPPQVDSAIIRIDTYEKPPVPVENVAAFFRVVRAGFAQRRKQLRNALARGLGLSTAVVTTALREAGIDPRRRAQTLSLAEWAAIVERLAVGNHSKHT